MPHPNELTLARALEVIAQGGTDGITLEQFGARYGGRRRRNGRLGTLRGVGSFLSRLADQGYVVRQGRRGQTRVALTRAGRDFLERWKAEWHAAQNEEPDGWDVR